MDSDVPHSDELDALYVRTATFSDDIAALHSTQQDLRRAKSGQVIQHRRGKPLDVFRSSPGPFTSPTPIPPMPSSPPPTPSPTKKRKAPPFDLGPSLLSRPAKAQRTYYGIPIHTLLADAEAECSLPKPAAELPTPPAEPSTSKSANTLWTEKYRARKFTDLLGDERTHRAVLHWLKRWDPIVFPGSSCPAKPKRATNAAGETWEEREKPHRKILLLTGPPGLGKTTLAHVCARQAGYEVQEINASDERSAGVVRGRIRDMVGTENVRGVDTRTVNGKVRKAGKPVCVIVDEVDGVVGSGSGAGGGGGEGGFIKALLDLILLDQRHSSALNSLAQAPARSGGKRKGGERFRFQRPLILICNDAYHPSLRLLRQSPHAETLHVRKPALSAVAARMQAIFDRENVPCEADGVRRLCEAAWGVSNRKEDRGGEGGGGEGDVRGVMVVGEWVAGRLREERRIGAGGWSGGASGEGKLTRKWVEQNVLQDLSHGGGAVRGVGRGSPKDIVARVFQEGAGFPKSTAIPTTPLPIPGSTTTPANPSMKTGVAEHAKRATLTRLRELLDTHADSTRILTDCWTAYPSHAHAYQDAGEVMGKPDQAYEWLHFHDSLDKAVFGSAGEGWELAPYLSTGVLGFHELFASSAAGRGRYDGGVAAYGLKARSEGYGHGKADGDGGGEGEEEAAHPFAGPQASWAAHEASKHNTALLQTLQASLSLDLTRMFSSPADLATDLLPYLLRMLGPRITPVVVGGGGGGGEAGTASVRKASEQELVRRAVNAMVASGVRLERTRVTADDPTAGYGSGGGYGGGGGGGWQSTQWMYRMEPAIDSLGDFATGGKGFGDVGADGKQRFAVRQVLEQEFRREDLRRAEAARQARFSGGGPNATTITEPAGVVRTDPSEVAAVLRQAEGKRDFFGRLVKVFQVGDEETEAARGRRVKAEQKGEGRVWVKFSEGYSNAVRKPVTMKELMAFGMCGAYGLESLEGQGVRTN
ncbi:Chromosome transmission fidelity protein 18 [Teratosphaeriaceae sp. CCFEE 6253]|nr:Chromosome transmission fidelity protein 18 [Teratosphaeriaceae sp. CCFEE 6253]